MAIRLLSDHASSADPVFKLPHPYLTPYFVANGDAPGAYQLHIRGDQAGAKSAPEDLRSEPVFFTEPESLKSSNRPSDSDNTAWARARRSPSFSIYWKQSKAPAFAQVWLAIYAIFTVRPHEEYVRVHVHGFGADGLNKRLQDVSLAVGHPQQAGGAPNPTSELLVLRGAFWQGAGSPFGPRPVWVLGDVESVEQQPLLSSYPLTALDYTMTNDPPSTLCWHPRRPVKPRPGSVMYSRYIPHLKETFSMVALDYQNKEHLDLFHQWQNDPRVSQGWNETGTLEQHREYLRRAHEDPHQITVLARFEDTFFAYFEVYWGKEDRLGAYYTAGDFDRGRHSLVGDVRFRGPHRVSAWWSSLMHYLYLDEPRTMYVVGEPKYTNTSVLMYDLMHGFGLDKFVDLPHKRSAFVRCSRERFFQLCPLDENEKIMGGTLLGLVPKL